MDIIAANGAELSSLALGPADAAPLVMLHGLVSGNMASWYSSIAVPLSATHRVLLYDQRGHGSSPVTPAGYDLDSQSDDLRAVLAHHGTGEMPLTVIGHSMGALIALRFALRWPQHVQRLVLVDAPMPACDHVAPSLRGVTSREALSDYVEQHLAGAAGLRGRRRERLQQRLASLFFDSSLLRDVLAMTAEPDAALRHLECPVLLLYGKRSPCLAAGLHLRKVLPDAELVPLDGGHYLPEEAPAALLLELRRFIDSNTGPAATGPAAPSRPRIIHQESLHR